MIIFSDLHLKESSADVVFGQVLPGIRAACDQHKDYHIAFLGDWWHIRYTVDVRLVNQVVEVLRGWSREGVMVDILVGNHDQVDVVGANALDVFNDLGNVTVHTEPGWTTSGLWVPYRKDIERVKEALRIPNPGGCFETIFMHQGVAGAIINNGLSDIDGIDPIVLPGMVFCGHYHAHQRLGLNGQIVYVGSPYQTRADEAGQDKGYIRWEDGQVWRRYVTDWGPKHHLVNLEAGQALDLSQVKPGDDVRVKAGQGVDIQALGQQLQAAGVQHAVTPDMQPIETRLQVEDGATLRAYAEAYVALQRGDLEQAKLMGLFDQITSGGAS